MSVSRHAVCCTRAAAVQMFPPRGAILHSRANRVSMSIKRKAT